MPHTVYHIDDYSSDDDDDQLINEHRPISAKRARVIGDGVRPNGPSVPITDSPRANWMISGTTSLVNWIGRAARKSKNTFQDLYIQTPREKVQAKGNGGDDSVVMAHGNGPTNHSTSRRLGDQMSSDDRWSSRRQAKLQPPQVLSSSWSKFESHPRPRGKQLDEPCLLATPTHPLSVSNAAVSPPTVDLTSISSRSRKFLTSDRTLRPNSYSSRESHQRQSSGRSVHEKLFNGSSANDKLPFRNSTVCDNIINLEERDRYRSLLQQYSSVQMDPTTDVNPLAGHLLPRKRNLPTKLDPSFTVNLKERLGFASKAMSHSSSQSPQQQQQSPLNRNSTVTDHCVWSLNSRPEVEVVQVLSRDVRPKTPSGVLSASKRLIAPASDEGLAPPESTCMNASVMLQRLAIPIQTIDVADDDDEIVQVPIDDVQLVTSKRKSMPPRVQQKGVSERINRCPYIDTTWLENRKSDYHSKDESNHKEISAYGNRLKKAQKSQTDEIEKRLRESLRFEEIVEDVEEEEKDALPVLSDEMLKRIESALVPKPPSEVLVEGFNLSIRRRDMETLAAINWLNDEIMNFYFNLLMERGRLDNYPSVFVCNTFFYPKLMNGGHAVLKRWTRKIDIFAHELMLVPVHLGVHWCLAVVDFVNKRVDYYDSMGGSNNACLKALLNYLKEEHKDKKGQDYDTSDWKQVNCKDNPRQLNGSDCGMFACKYAEYLSRRAKITFAQADMPYFRKRMVYEILTKQLL